MKNIIVITIALMVVMGCKSTSPEEYKAKLKVAAEKTDKAFITCMIRTMAYVRIRDSALAAGDAKEAASKTALSKVDFYESIMDKEQLSVLESEHGLTMKEAPDEMKDAQMAFDSLGSAYLEMSVVSTSLSVMDDDTSMYGGAMAKRMVAKEKLLKLGIMSLPQ